MREQPKRPFVVLLSDPLRIVGPFENDVAASAWGANEFNNSWPQKLRWHLLPLSIEPGASGLLIQVAKPWDQPLSPAMRQVEAAKETMRLRGFRPVDLVSRRFARQRQRPRYSAAERERVFDAFKGICVLCEQPIASGQDWQIVHIAVPHVHGGDNVGPGHRRCHAVETATVTLPLIAKVKRVRRRHIGAFETTDKLPCGRHTPLKKGVDGTIKVRLSSRERDEAIKAEAPYLDHSKLPIARRSGEEQ